MIIYKHAVMISCLLSLICQSIDHITLWTQLRVLEHSIAKICQCTILWIQSFLTHMSASKAEHMNGEVGI